MAFIDWKSGFETGIPFIDEDHKVLVDLLNHVHRTLDDPEESATLGSILNALVDYTEYHFAREEKLLEAVGYRHLEAHRKEHDQLAQEVRDVRNRYEDDPTSIRAEDIAKFLDNWLIDHIVGRDLDYREAVFAKPDAWVASEAVRFDHPAEPGDGEGAEPHPPEAGVDWASCRVIAVDDNRNFQVMLSTLLKALGVREMRCADSAEDGLDALDDGAADLVLCDWRMGGMDGIEFVRRLREAGSTAKVIMLTGYGDAETRAEAEAAGVDGFLEKPITARGFLEAVARVMGDA